MKAAKDVCKLLSLFGSVGSREMYAFIPFDLVIDSFFLFFLQNALFGLPLRSV